jgi:hypothetical protein
MLSVFRDAACDKKTLDLNDFGTTDITERVNIMLVIQTYITEVFGSNHGIIAVLPDKYFTIFLTVRECRR